MTLLDKLLQQLNESTDDIRDIRQVYILRTMERGEEEWVIVTADKQLPLQYCDTRLEARKTCKKNNWTVVR